MSKRHKWYREICAWADGAEIEARYNYPNQGWTEWQEMSSTCRFLDDDWWEFRIKPQPKESRLIKEMKENIEDLRKSLGNERIEQPKEPKYLYVYGNIEDNDIRLSGTKFEKLDYMNWYPIGKIKLEVDDEDN